MDVLMATDLDAVVRAEINWLFKGDITLAEAPLDRDKISKVFAFDFGTTAGLANEMWRDRRRLTPSTPTDDLDLYGTETNAFGDTLNFATIRAILIVNRGTDDGDGTFTETAGDQLLVGGAGASAFSAPWNNDDDAKSVVGPGTPLIMAEKLTGWTVTNSTADTLRIVNDGANDITYDIVLIGTK